MSQYRVTIRYGAPGARYEVIDLDAADLAAALRSAADRLSGEVLRTAELAEVRRRTGPDGRAFTPD